jgi:hypothetical protein
MEPDKYYIYPYNWWPGFENRADANHIGFFEKLFFNTKLKNHEITNNLDRANVLLEAGKPDEKLRNIKKWTYKINFIGEPDLPIEDNYDLVLTSVNNIKNIVDLPLAIMYIHCNNFLPRLLTRSRILSTPSSFCTFIVSNPKCEIRNRIFEKLNSYKLVHSMGRHANNVGYNLHYPYWSDQYFNVIGSHKFMICGENTKMTTYSTEKIVNPYIAQTIPIYWGTHNIKNIFNPDSMLFLEDETDESFNRLIEKIIELDNDDEKYLEFINRPVFNTINIDYWAKNYTLDALGKKVNHVLL